MSNRRNDRHKCMTSNQGAPIENDSHSLTVGIDGPVILRDLHLIDKLAHFNRERIPERVVHAKGAGAHGYFKLTNSMGKYTKARVFNEIGLETEAFVRFSTVIGSKGSPDTARDPRGFAVKLYTDDGNLDIVGNNLPVFFIRDAIKFPDLIHAFKPSPDNNLHDPNRFWDFISCSPEATHMITFLFSDYGTIKSYRKMKGFGVNTYVWINERGEK
ncbi:catalase, partial [Clostridium sp.]